MPEKPPPDPARPVGNRPLPVTITPGMPVIDINDGILGSIVGITQAYCIYRLFERESLIVARWQEIALGNVCPAEPLLLADVEENDRRNAMAAVLRELLALRQFGLTETQTAVLDELIAKLAGN